MEILYTNTIDIEEVANACDTPVPQRPEPPPRDRSKWHVTSLLNAAYNISKGVAAYSDGVDKVTGIMSFGIIWEHAIDCYMRGLAADLGGVYTYDITKEYDGIVASLDGLLYDFDRYPSPIVVETKLRFSTSEVIPLKHIQQMRAYCYVAGTELVYYISGHINTRPPEVTAYLRMLRFTQSSIGETWNGLVATKRYLEKLGIYPDGAK